MTGMAALAICAAFTSCSKGEDVYDPNRNPEVDNLKLSYEQAFVKVFAQPSKAQDWGFGSGKASTRASINVEGNLEKYENAPTLGDKEEDDVVAYVQSLTVKPNTNPIELQNYFVTQVHCGTETYSNNDGVAGIKGSAHMDNLHIAMQEDATVNEAGALVGDWEHINNFNRGDNTDWNGNTLVEEGGTFDFAYHGSEDAKYHNRWIAIDGKDVPRTGGGNYAGNYYVCFDFEATVDGTTVVSNIEYWDPVLGNWQNSSTIEIPGSYTKDELLASNMEISIPVKGWDAENSVTVIERWVTVNLSNESQVKSLSWSNIKNGNQQISPNSSYLDWIVRLVKAEPKNTNTDPDPEYTKCVIGEDLTFGEDLDTDFDFNDVVFDVAFNVPGKTYIRLKAAGGTLPLIIGVANPSNDQNYPDNEVHNLFGVGTSTMVNTKAEDSGLNGASKPYKEFYLETKYSNARDIPVFVKKGSAWVELTANQGEPASKIGVSTSFVWCNERVSLKQDYPLFTKWVEAQDPGTVEWY